MSWVDMIGYAASGTVLAAFCMTSMFHLRQLAIASNLLFICFGALAHVYPVLLLHMALLPVNFVHLLQTQARGTIPRTVVKKYITPSMFGDPDGNRIVCTESPADDGH
jgi:hypothetical protein